MRSFFAQRITPTWAGALSLAALLISFLSLYYSCRSTTIAEKSYLISVDPLIALTLDYDRNTNEYSLTLTNDGSIPVSEVHVMGFARIFNSKSRVVQASGGGGRDWVYYESIAPQEHKKISFNKDELINTMKLAKALPSSSSEELLPVELVYVSYIRNPDRKRYGRKEYYFLGTDENSKTGAIMVWHVTGHFYEDMREKLIQQDKDLETEIR